MPVQSLSALRKVKIEGNPSSKVLNMIIRRNIPEVKTKVLSTLTFQDEALLK